MQNPKLTREKKMATQRNIIIITCRPVFSFFTMCGKTVKKKTTTYIQCVFLLDNSKHHKVLVLQAQIILKTVFFKEVITSDSYFSVHDALFVTTSGKAESSGKVLPWSLLTHSNCVCYAQDTCPPQFIFRAWFSCQNINLLCQFRCLRTTLRTIWV